MKRVLFLILVAAEIPLFPQVGSPGNYPPRTYPPGTYPPGQTGQRPGIPWPSRKKKNAEDTPTKSTTGKLTSLDEKSIVVEVPDGRTIDFKRTDRTKFFRGIHEMRSGDVKPGSQVTVESTEDQEGYLYAVNVKLPNDSSPPEAQTEAKPAPPAAQQAGGPTDEKGPAPETKQVGGRAEGNMPAAQDASDSESGPPKLRRGVPAHRQNEDEDAAADSDTTPSAPAKRGGTTEMAKATAAPAEATVEPEEEDADPLIEKAREATLNFTEKLPNYVCKEFMARYRSSTRPVDWKAMDVVSTSIVYEGGRESYRDISINGKTVNKGMEQMSGSWSTGEFATTLIGLFAPWTAAEFHLSRQDAIEGVEARVYNYEVDRPHSRWLIQVASQSIRPAYKGSVWIEPATGRVLRIEMQARKLPEDFPMDTIESAIDYDNVQIAGQKFLLPAHAETLACQRGSSECSRNAIDFRNYHKFEATSDVTFK